jgi:predicted Zn-dependent peptidase
MVITATDLSNGLKHIHVQKKDSEAATVIFMVGVGSKFEERRISGISHYLEHMFFKGTTTRKDSVEIAEYIEEIGGTFNAFTGKEYTGYYAMVAKQHTERAFDFVSDLVLNATFPEDEMEKEKGVVIEEMNMYNDMPMKLVSEKFEELMYGDTPAGWQIIGNKESVSGLTHKDVTDYVTKHYNTENSVVVTVSPASPDKMKEKAEQYFSKVGAGEKSMRETAQPDGSGPAVLLATKETDQTHLCLGFPTVSLKDDSRYAASLVSAVLGGGMSSRLFTEIREKRGLCYYVRASQDSYSDAGYFVIQAGIDNTKVEEAVKAMMAELKKVKEEGITEKELKKVKEYLKGKLALSLEGSQETAVFMAEQYVLQGKTETVEDKWKKIDAVTLEDTQDFISSFFVDDQVRFALIGPFDDEEKFKSLLTF